VDTEWHQFNNLRNTALQQRREGVPLNNEMASYRENEGHKGILPRWSVCMEQSS